MKDQFKDLYRLFDGRSSNLPPEIQSPRELETLTEILPRCPYRLVGAVGNELTHRPFSGESPSRPKRLDVDLVIPFIRCTPKTWQELSQVVKGSSEFTNWDNGNIIVPLEGESVCFLNPDKYFALEPESCQQQVARVFADQVNPDDRSFHQVATGEGIIFIGRDIGKLANPKDDKFQGVYADVYPLVLDEGQREADALIARGYLAQNGCVVILSNGHAFNLPVDTNSRLLSGLDESYLSRSPQHAIQFLRRLTKSTIDVFARQGFSDNLPNTLVHFTDCYQTVISKYVSANLDDVSLHEPMRSLTKKINKLKKIIEKENIYRKAFRRSPLSLELS